MNRGLVLVGLTATLLLSSGHAQGDSDAAEVDCSRLPSTADLRELRSAVGTVFELRAPTSYYPGCDEPGDPLVADVTWGDGTAKRARLEPVPGSPRGLTVVARHRYSGVSPASGFQIVIYERNERTGVVRTDRHYIATVVRRPRIRVAHLSRHRRRFTGEVARMVTGGWDSATALKAKIAWGDGSSSLGTLVQKSYGFLVRGRHVWRRRVLEGRLVVTVEDRVSRARFMASRRIRVR